MSISDKYRLVIGIETHIELATESKIFCGCTTAFAGDPNTRCCPVCTGMPGVLPKLNRKVVEWAVMAGLATNCRISPESFMARKNYIYPDLAKAYQISQHQQPLCTEGHVELASGKRVRITEIHIEEDAGKLVHTNAGTFVDYNRGGVPLIEIVSEPDMSSAEEAREYVEKLQLIARHLGISDCRMQEGSLRCDVNVSVCRKDSDELGTRSEIKNMNSFAFMVKAIEYEFERQVEAVENGETIVQETRRWDEDSGTTESMRDKEDAHDYRYFPDPDLLPIYISAEEIEAIRRQMPELPDVKTARYTGEYELTAQDAGLIVKYSRIADFFEKAIKGVSRPKTVANMIIGQIFRRLNGEEGKEAADIPIPPEFLGELVQLIESGKLSMNIAKNALEKMLDSGKRVTEVLDPSEMSEMDDSALSAAVDAAIAGQPAAVADFKAGKEKALKALIGSVMKETRGKANAQAAEAMLIEKIGKL